VSYPIEPWMKEARQAAHANRTWVPTAAEHSARVAEIRRMFAGSPDVFAACSVCRATVTLPETRCAAHKGDR
jgi:hypothetical protein